MTHRGALKSLTGNNDRIKVKRAQGKDNFRGQTNERVVLSTRRMKSAQAKLGVVEVVIFFKGKKVHQKMKNQSSSQ